VQLVYVADLINRIRKDSVTMGKLGVVVPEAEMMLMANKTRSRARFQDPMKLIPRVLRKLHSEWLRLTYPFVSMGRKTSIHPTSFIDRKNAHRIKLGAFIRIEKDTCLGLSVPPEEDGEPVIVIDDNCVIHWRTQIGAKNRIHLERDVIVAQDVLIVDQNHAYEDITLPIGEQGFTKGGTIRIGEGSYIGHGSAIICSRGSLTLGRNCVVAAHSVVTRSAPPYSVLSGNPAMIVRQYDPVKQTWVVGSVRAAEGESDRVTSKVGV
jgi:acetyltransferase-like isoleucine patch superfamily enzyme